MQSSSSNVVLGVTGSIAAYKACSLLRTLLARGAQVRVVMTAAAQRLVGPATFRALSGRPVVTELFVPESAASIQHVELADWADVLVVAPATANFIGKAACGIADDALTCTWMACDCPKVVAPAMNDRMWRSPALQANVERLRATPRVRIVGPVEGPLADGRVGMGHLAPVEQIADAVFDALAQTA